MKNMNRVACGVSYVRCRQKLQENARAEQAGSAAEIRKLREGAKHRQSSSLIRNSPRRGVKKIETGLKSIGTPERRNDGGPRPISRESEDVVSRRSPPGLKDGENPSQFPKNLDNSFGIWYNHPVGTKPNSRETGPGNNSYTVRNHVHEGMRILRRDRVPFLHLLAFRGVRP